MLHLGMERSSRLAAGCVRFRKLCLDLELGSNLSPSPGASLVATMGLAPVPASRGPQGLDRDRRQRLGLAPGSTE